MYNIKKRDLNIIKKAFPKAFPKGKVDRMKN